MRFTLDLPDDLYEWLGLRAKEVYPPSRPNVRSVDEELVYLVRCVMEDHQRTERWLHSLSSASAGTSRRDRRA